MENILKDKRFLHIAKDPKFRRIPKNEHKIKVDKRFQTMFKDKKFSIKYTIDKRGRPINQTSTENLKKYYDYSSSDKNSSDEESEFSIQKRVFTKIKQKFKDKKEKYKIKKCLKKNEIEAKNNNLNSKINKKSEALENEKELKIRTKSENVLHYQLNKKVQNFSVDYARGEKIIVSNSSSSEESSEYENEYVMDHNWGELNKEIETTNVITNRLAVCNMDWDRIRALDLMVLFNSFLPTNGLINNITIYPSEFGLQRIKDEELRGPIELIEANKISSWENNKYTDDENKQELSYHMENLRQYQLNRLKYYYAIIVFDSASTANRIYNECDGLEYESSSNKLDLRFVPNDMIFCQKPKEFCNELPDLIRYTPRQFTTTALQQVKVDLTWDETNPERKEINQKLNCGKFDDIHESDIHTYLATGSSEDETEVNIKKQLEEIDSLNVVDNPVDKYKLLLKSLDKTEEEKQNKEVELEFTWGLNVKKKAEKLVKEKMKKMEKLTPFEQYLEKRKTKKIAKREQKRKNSFENNINDSSNEDSVLSDIDFDNSYFSQNLSNIKSNSKRKKNTPRSVNLDMINEEKEKTGKSELELLLMDECKSKNYHFNMKKIEEAEISLKSKKKSFSKNKKDLKHAAIKDTFEIDVNDPRFNALFTSHHYNIDPADSHYRKTKGTEILIQEKLKRRIKNHLEKETIEEFTNEENNYSNFKVKADLNNLIKSVKKHTKDFKKCIK